MGFPSLNAHEQQVAFDFLAVLAASRDIPAMQAEAYPLLVELIPAEHAAFCVSNPDRPGGYDWLPMNLPPAWFAGYADMAPHDFVRDAVVGAPNLVLRDEDMIERPSLERSFVYQRAHDLDMSLEHVMAVLLHAGQEARDHAGVTLYRDRRRPFSERERQLLQLFVPHIAYAVRNKKLLTEENAARTALGSALQGRGCEAVVVAPPAREIARTPGATALLERWFSPSERRQGGLPACLWERLEEAASSVGSLPADWLGSREGAELRVSFVRAPGPGAMWALVLKEVSRAQEIPQEWMQRGLTPREIEVTARLLRGWDNRLVAEDLGCSLETVKKHAYHIFNKLGVSTRAALLRAATVLQG